MKSKSVIDFFMQKRGWSEVKDLLLSWYLTPYLAKVFSVAKNFYFIDGFSGPGLFDDGKKGSPEIENDLIKKAYESTNNSTVKYSLICVEKNKILFDRLTNNLKENKNVKCINDDIELLLPNLIQNLEKNSFVFIYLDPFGINGLPSNLITLCNARKDLKIELLINFNSSGCYRECMRLLGNTAYNDFFDENEYLSDKNSSHERMNCLLGTKKWTDVAGDAKAEYLLSQYFSDNLRKAFKYVLNMPIRNIKNDMVKYRMIFCSNNIDGALLMADNMLRRSNNAKNSLFSLDIEGNIVDVTKEVETILDFVPNTNENPIRLNQLILSFYEKKGVVCSPKDLIDYLKMKERNNEIVVIRYPERSAKGKFTTFWSESNKKTVKILKKIGI